MIAYLDAPSGISGDMFLGCLVDAGWSLEQLRFAIARLKLPGDEWSIEAGDCMKGALRAMRVQVHAAEGHVHRHLSDVRGIIQSSDLPQAVRDRAVAVFVRLANAEAKVHGTTPEKIHFHEVGAIDAIIDVVGVCAGLAELGIEKLYASPLPLGPGWVNTAHGQLPLPAPATLELLAAANAPTRPGPGPGELVTPTGAALVAEIATFGQPAMSLSKIAWGAGTRDCPWPNVARLWLGQPIAPAAASLVQLETNIDDMNPQLFSAVSDKLFAAGAKDVWFTPIQMKKNRPAVLLSALGPAALESELSQVMLTETTTLGVRVHAVQDRHEARREMGQVDTSYGPVRVKIKYVNGAPSGVTPEYDDCKALAEKAGVAVRAAWESAAAAAQDLLSRLRAG